MQRAFLGDKYRICYLKIFLKNRHSENQPAHFCPYTVWATQTAWLNLPAPTHHFDSKPEPLYWLETKSSWFSPHLFSDKKDKVRKKNKVTNETLEPTQSGRVVAHWVLTLLSHSPRANSWRAEQLLSWTAFLKSPAPLVDLVSCSPSSSSLFTLSVRELSQCAGWVGTRHFGWNLFICCHNKYRKWLSTCDLLRSLQTLDLCEFCTIVGVS